VNPDSDTDEDTMMIQSTGVIMTTVWLFAMEVMGHSAVVHAQYHDVFLVFSITHIFKYVTPRLFGTCMGLQ